MSNRKRPESVVVKSQGDSDMTPQHVTTRLSRVAPEVRLDVVGGREHAAVFLTPAKTRELVAGLTTMADALDPPTPAARLSGVPSPSETSYAEVDFSDDAAARLDAAADAIVSTFTFCRTPEGEDYWFDVLFRLRRMTRAAADQAWDREAEAAAKERAAYLAPCPPGYGTVLGHLTQQGKQPEDAGMREGQRLARAAKTEGVAAMWVQAPAALEDICDRVRAYPAFFLVKHLGGTDPNFEVPEKFRPSI